MKTLYEITKDYKYWDQIGFWIEEDNGYKSFIFFTDNPYFESFKRQYLTKYFGDSKRILSLVFFITETGTLYIISVKGGEYMFTPMDGLIDKLNKFIHGYNFPTLYEYFGLTPRLSDNFFKYLDSYESY